MLLRRLNQVLDHIHLPASAAAACGLIQYIMQLHQAKHLSVD